MSFEIFVHMSFGLPRSLQTAFDLKNIKPASKNTPDAATLTLHALNLLKAEKINIIFQKTLKASKFSKETKFTKYGGQTRHACGAPAGFVEDTVLIVSSVIPGVVSGVLPGVSC